MRARILWSAVVLGVMAMALPVRIPDPSAGKPGGECLTLTDKAPDASRADAIPAYERCSQLDPTDVESMADLGLLYESAGRRTEAEQMYRRALAADPGFADLRLRLGRLLIARGDRAGAREQAQTAQPNRGALLDLLREAGGD
jgi:tetratricopeptide (TPR) repeat protein